jgi:hypothetical protein
VPNAIRGADDFIGGAADALYFAFGGPKVREADATVGGIRVLAIPESAENLTASRKLFSLRLPHAGRADPAVRRGDAADAGLHLRLHAVHQRQDQGRRRLQDDRHPGEQQGRPRGGRATPAGVLRGGAPQEVQHAVSRWRTEVFRRSQHAGRGDQVGLWSGKRFDTSHTGAGEGKRTLVCVNTPDRLSNIFFVRNIWGQLSIALSPYRPHNIFNVLVVWQRV